MALVNGNIRLRESKPNTATALAETFNTLHDLIIGSGMLKASDTDVTGQAGKFVTTSPQVGETQVLHDLTTGAMGDRLLGYKVYQHPNLKFYLKVSFIDYVVYVSSTASGQVSYAKITYQMATQIKDGAIVQSSASSVFSPLSTHFSTNINSGYVDTSLVTTNYLQTSIACSDKCFWIGKIGAITLANNSGYAKLPVSPNEFGIAIIASQTDNSKLCILFTQNVLSSTNSLDGEFLNTLNRPTGIRYAVLNGTAFETRENCAAGYLIDPQTMANLQGVRVAKAKLIIAGVEHYFDFGFVNASALNQMQTVNVNIVGQQKNYMALHNFGSACPSYPALSLNNMSIAVLPME